MLTLLHSRLIVQTALSSITVIRRRSRVKITRNKRTINSSRSHATLRRIVRADLRGLFDTHVGQKHNLIGSRHKQVNRHHANGKGRLTLTLKRTKAITFRRYIMTLKRRTSRTIHVSRAHNLSTFLVNNIRTTMASIIRRNTNRRIRILRRSTREPTRIELLSTNRKSTVVRGLTILSIMRPISRINRNNLTNANNTSRHSLLTKLNRPNSIIRRQLIQIMTRNRINRTRITTRRNRSTIKQNSHLLLNLRRRLTNQTLRLFYNLREPHAIITSLALPYPITNLIISFNRNTTVLTGFRISRHRNTLIFLSKFIRRLRSAKNTNRHRRRRNRLLKSLTSQISRQTK